MSKFRKHQHQNMHWRMRLSSKQYSLLIHQSQNIIMFRIIVLNTGTINHVSEYTNKMVAMY